MPQELLPVMCPVHFLSLWLKGPRVWWALAICLCVPFVAPLYVLICFLETQAFREEGPELVATTTRVEMGLNCNIVGTATLIPTEWLS